MTPVEQFRAFGAHSRKELFQTAGSMFQEGRTAMKTRAIGCDEPVSSACTDLIPMAERELAAFFGAVNERFGAEQARLSAEDWLEELTYTDRLPGVSISEWQRLTAAATSHLVERLRSGAGSIEPMRRAS